MSRTTLKAKRPKTTPIPVRFDAHTILGMDEAAPRLGGNRATFIRLAVGKLLSEVETGRLILN